MAEAGPPPQIDANSLADYLSVMSKAVFQSGMSWKVVESKWPGTADAFFGFDPTRVATLSPEEIDRISADPRIIRNRRKVEAIIYNAQKMLELDQHEGGFVGWLRKLGDFEAQLKAFRKEFKFMGDAGGYFFLYVVKEPVPSHEEFCARGS